MKILSKLLKIIKKSYIVLIIVAIILSIFVYRHYTNPDVIAANNAAKAQEMTSETIQAVGKLLVLPQGEEPAIFDVKDPAVLTSQQPFFEGSVQGDKLLVYQTSGKAIIYSPSRNIIVNVGPVNFDAPAVQATTTKK